MTPNSENQDRQLDQLSQSSNPESTTEFNDFLARKLAQVWQQESCRGESAASPEEQSSEE